MKENELGMRQSNTIVNCIIFENCIKIVNCIIFVNCIRIVICIIFVNCIRIVNCIFVNRIRIKVFIRIIGINWSSTEA